jgi:hypothetical protein
MVEGRGGLGTRKHYVAGNGNRKRAGQSPKMRHHLKREAEKNEIKAKGRIKNPKSSIRDLFS